MSVYLKLINLQQQIDSISTRGVTTAGSVNLTNALTASYVSASNAMSGALVYAGRLTGSAVSGTLIYAGQLTGSAVSSSLVYAGQLTGSAVSGTLIYAGRLTGSAVSSSLVYAGQLTGSAVSGTLIYAGRLTGSAVSSSLIYANSLTASGLLVSQDHLQIGTNGKGINFSIANASTDSSGVTISSQILTDYKEGTWTPQVSGAAIAGAPTSYAVQLGRFTKIGRIVHLQAVITWSGHTGTGGLRIGNLPFTVLNNDAESTGFLQYSNLTVPFSSIAFVQALKNTTQLKVLSISTGSANSAALDIDAAATCAFSITYEID